MWTDSRNNEKQDSPEPIGRASRVRPGESQVAHRNRQVLR